MRVRFSIRAKADLFGIGAWIERDNPARAASFVEEIAHACFGLADMPLAFALLAGHEESGIRRRPYGAYLIFYIVGSERIDIVRVLHGARDYEQLLFPG
ncbi:MAG: type II toxin-antitoxin system RelE/ParE family toxin [Rhizomicrobium sp.]